MIRVVCTGKGTHREMFLGSFDFGRLVTGRMSGNGVQWGQPYDGDWRQANGEPLKTSYTYDCRRCQRNPQLKATTLRVALDGLRAAGQSTLDISQLPF